LPEVRIEAGERANLTIIDPAMELIVRTNDFKSKSKNSPFDGFKLKGKPIGVMNNRKFYWNGEII
jgi:dihydroorotase